MRTSVRGVVAAVLLLAALALGAIFTPWSLPWLDRWFQTRWNAAVGVPLTFDRAVFRLSGGLVQIESPRLQDPETGQILLELDSIDIDFPAGQLLAGQRPYVIESLDLRGRLEVRARLEGNQIVLEEPYSRLWELLQKCLAPPAPAPAALVPAAPALPAASPAVLLRRFSASQVALSLVDPQRPAAVLEHLDGLQLTCEFNPSGQPSLAVIEGCLNPAAGLEAKPNLSLFLRPAGQGRRVHFSLRLEDFSSVRDVPLPLSMEVQAQALSVQGAVEALGAGVWSLKANASAARLHVCDPQDGWQDLGAFKLTSLSRVDWPARRLEVQALDLDSLPLDIKARGDLDLVRGGAFRLQVDPLRVQGRGLSLVLDQFQQSSGLLDDPQASVSVQASMTGLIDEPRSLDLTGKVQLSGVDLVSEQLPWAPRNLRAQATLTTQSLVLDELSGVIYGVPVQLKGTISGQPMRGKIDRIEVDWAVAAGLAQLEDLINQYRMRADQPVVASGNISGQGRIVMDEPLAGELRQALDRVKVYGQVKLDKVSVKSEAWPAGVQALSGQLEVQPGRLTGRELSGKLAGMPFELDGQLQGSKRFWHDTVFSGQLNARLDLERLKTMAVQTGALGTTVTQALNVLPLAGQCGVDLLVREGRADGSAQSLRLGLTLQDVATSFSTPIARGPLVVRSGHILVDPSHLNITHMKGSLGELAFVIESLNRPQGGELSLRLQGGLPELKRRVPLALCMFRVDGTVDARHSFNWQATSQASGAQSWAEWAGWLREQAAQGGAQAAGRWLAGQLRLQNHGTLDLKDAEVTFISMPGYLRGITGQARYDQRHLWIEDPVTVDAGEGSRNLHGTLDFIYPAPGQPMTFRWDVTGEHFNLSPWVTRWPRPRPDWGELGPPPGLDRLMELVRSHGQTAGPAQAPPGGADHNTSPTQTAAAAAASSPTLGFVMNGTLASSSATFMGVTGEDFSGRLDLEMYHGDHPGELRWSDLKAKVHGGQVTVRGRFGDPCMTTRVELENVEAAALARDMLGRTEIPGIFSGVVTGWLDLGFPFNEEPFFGNGEVSVVKSRFVSNALFHSLGGVLKLPLFEDISFSHIKGPFGLRGQQVRLDGISFENPVVNMVATGTVGPEWALELELQMRFLQAVGNIPLVGQAVDLFNRLAGNVVAFKIQGSLHDPKVTPTSPLPAGLGSLL